MIISGFLLVYGIFLLFAHLSGDALYFVNPDSLLPPLAACIIFSFCTFRGQAFLTGVRSMFALRAATVRPDSTVALHYRALMLVSVAAGVVSSMQGLISYSLGRRDMDPAALAMPFTEAFAYASFSTAYAVIISVFLLYPVSLAHRERPGTATAA